MKQTISVIIPTFNEENKIGRTIDVIREAHHSDRIAEIIVVDGGSTDQTLDVVQQKNICLVNCRHKSRARQMNAGAEKATSTILYFLHADTLPPKDFVECILSAVAKGYVAGSFRLRFDSSDRFLKLMTWFTRFKTTLLRFGDQSLFVRKDTFNAVGGFDNSLSLMEDQDIVRRLKRSGKFALCPERVTTSARKFIVNGPVRLMAVFVFLYLLYYLGLPQDKLKKLYRKMIRNGKT